VVERDLPRPPLQRAVAALALLLATVMVNVAPENPYLHNMAADLATPASSSISTA
jgi:hypothetical protein